jgi:hypothetical protein
MVAHGLLTAYDVRRKRSVVTGQPAEQDGGDPDEAL